MEDSVNKIGRFFSSCVLLLFRFLIKRVKIGNNRHSWNTWVKVFLAEARDRLCVWASSPCMWKIVSPYGWLNVKCFRYADSFECSRRWKDRFILQKVENRKRQQAVTPLTKRQDSKKLSTKIKLIKIKIIIRVNLTIKRLTMD